MKILIINCGSSSIKFQVHDNNIGHAIVKGIIAKIGQKSSYFEKQVNGKKSTCKVRVPSHAVAFDLIVKMLEDASHGILKNISEISAVGHRAVHGGSVFTSSVLITEAIINKIEELIPLAPLHNPANITGIREAKRVFPNVPHVAVFDTAFHQTLPPKAYLYALPYIFYEKYRIRKYGFHGTSCRYVSRKAAVVLGKTDKELRMIICHLGNGVTVTAVNRGESIDTSMGLTPLEGPMMGTRSGDIDPGVIFFLHRQTGMTADSIDEVLNRESGLLGVSGTSNDMREIQEGIRLGDKRCQLAVEMFAYRVKKYIGAYAAALGGIDALVFTAGIGENSPFVRAMICEGLNFLGIELDSNKNNDAKGMDQIISTSNSAVSVVVIPTNEEEIIASDTLMVVGL
ncbi:acetate/propionate family kinase [Chloroflexota bacterium]